MTLPAATHIGPYEVVGFIGAGGMGEVYHVRDHRLSRDAALKILPPAYSADSDRLMRFEREARAMAAIAHDNVLAVYDVGTFEDRPYLVTELLDGQSLRAWLGSTKPSISRAAEIGAQIARGLAVAHGRGVLHRDLKPENVFVLRDGRVKILDFGLAKLREVDESALTKTMRDATDSGVILGTAAYMAPEQARGLPVDERADIFALGAVLYELFSGRRAFGGTTRADVMTAVIKDDPPPFGESGRTVPPFVERIVRRCLEKEREARFQAASDLAFALEAVSATSSTSAADVPAIGMPRRRWRQLLAYGMLALGGATAGFWLRPSAPASPPPSFRFSITADPTARWPVSAGIPSVAIDARGETVAWAIPDGRHSLMIRRLHEAEARMVDGSLGATSPFFSPDGRWLGFHADGILKRVPVEGGFPTSIGPVNELRGAVWGEDDRIIYATLTGVWRVAIAGGEPESILARDEGVMYVWPMLLPGGKTMVLTRRAGLGLGSGSLVAVDLETKVPRHLLDNANDAAYAEGRLFFGREESLWSVPFDPARAEVTGGDSPAVGQVERAPGNGETQFAISATGTLAFVPYLPRSESTLQLLDAAGGVEPAPFDVEPSSYSFMAVAPDGLRVALRSTDHLLITRLDVKSTTRMPSAAIGYGNGVGWISDRRVLFAGGPGIAAVYSIAADGTGSPERLTTPGSHGHYLHDVSRNGEVIYQEQQSGAPKLMARLPSGGTRTIAVPPLFGRARVSLDGRWLAYSTLSRDVMLQSMDGDAASAVPIGQGRSPFWAADGTRVFYLRTDAAGGTAVSSLRVRDGVVAAGTQPQILFACADCIEVDDTGTGRFLVLRRVLPPARAATFNVAVNWIRELDGR